MKDEALLSSKVDAALHYTAPVRVVKDQKFGYFVRLLLEGGLVGVAAGLVGVAFRVVLARVELYRDRLLIWSHGLPFGGWMILPLLGGFAAAVAGWLTGFAPEAAGSGIPHVEAVLIRQRRLVWWRVLPVKFIAGALAIGAGFSLGREGPTVQMGAAAAQAVSRSLSRPKGEELQLIAYGAGAGLAAAFNAPLAGVIFVLGELWRNFSPYILGGAVAACVSADLVAQSLVGPLPTFRVNTPVGFLPLSSLPLIVILGAVAGVLGGAFNRSLEKVLDLAAQRNRVPRWARGLAVALLAGII